MCVSLLACVCESEAVCGAETGVRLDVHACTRVYVLDCVCERVCDCETVLPTIMNHSLIHIFPAIV